MSLTKKTEPNMRYENHNEVNHHKIKH